MLQEHRLLASGQHGGPLQVLWLQPQLLCKSSRLLRELLRLHPLLPKQTDAHAARPRCSFQAAGAGGDDDGAGPDDDAAAAADDLSAAIGGTDDAGQVIKHKRIVT